MSNIIKNQIIKNLTIKGLAVKRGNKSVVENVSLEVSGGEWVTLLGPNGAGKTTLLKAIAGLVKFEGSINVDGVQISRQSSKFAKLFSYCPQNPVIPEAMTVFDYVLLGRTAHISTFGIESSVDIDVVRQTMINLDLKEFANSSLLSLSGGERQRAILARALVQQAPILLLDEPTTSLDVGHQQEVLELIDQLRRDHALTVVSTMHDLTLAGLYSDRVGIVSNGKLVEINKPEQVLTASNVKRYFKADVEVTVVNGVVNILPFRPLRII